MLPDLGKYTLTVLSAYGAMLVLIVGLILVSLRSGRKSKETLAMLEQKRKAKAHD